MHSEIRQAGGETQISNDFTGLCRRRTKRHLKKKRSPDSQKPRVD